MGPLVAALLAALTLAPAPALATARRIPDFSGTGVTARSSFEVSRASLSGRPWVASFIYSRCRSSCPMIASGLQRLQGMLDPRVQIVSFSVDPAYDTPRRLRRFAKKLGAEPGRWLFVNMPVSDLGPLMREGFRLQDDPHPEAEVVHSGRVVLVDADGLVRGTFDGWDENSLLLLGDEARRLIPAEPAARR